MTRIGVTTGCPPSPLSPLRGERARVRGFTVMEVVLAVSLGVLLLVGVASAFNAYRTQTNYNRGKMMLTTARSNITMFKYRKGQFPPISCDTGSNPSCSSICTNRDDSVTPPQPFFSGSDMGKVPIDPVKNVAALNMQTACAAGSPAEVDVTAPNDTGGWLYTQTGSGSIPAGTLRINLRDSEATYGVAEDQPSKW